MILLLKETLEGSAAIDALLEMSGDNNLPILAGRLGFDNHMISVTDGIFYHRASLDPQGIERTPFGTWLLKDCSLWAIREHVERHSCCNGAYNRNADWPPGEFDPSTLPRRAGDPSEFFEHAEVVVNVAGTGNSHRMTNLANSWWHAFGLDEADNEIIDGSLEIAAWFHEHKPFPLLAFFVRNRFTI
jgi:hypothetical protein